MLFPVFFPRLHTILNIHLQSYENQQSKEIKERIPSTLPKNISSSSENSTLPRYPLYSMIFFISTSPVLKTLLTVSLDKLLTLSADVAYAIKYFNDLHLQT